VKEGSEPKGEKDDRGKRDILRVVVGVKSFFVVWRIGILEAALYDCMKIALFAVSAEWEDPGPAFILEALILAFSSTS